MASGTGADRTLLERLNALKPTTVRLDPSLKSAVASTTEPAKPPSREDALSERLKSLRNQSHGKVPSASSSGASRRDSNATSQPTPSQTTQLRPSVEDSGPDRGAQTASAVEEGIDSADNLLITDDQTLEELLADLESDQQWLDEVVAEEEEHRRVTLLLEELGKASQADHGLDHSGSPKSANAGRNDSEQDSDDDSEGERMIREADIILAQAVDEADWDKAHRPVSPPDPGAPAASHDHKLHGSSSTTKPAVARSAEDPFGLPTVPLELQDQPDLAGSSQEDADFAASITSRMVALRVSAPASPTLPSAPTSDVDVLGLPAAPTFVPADRPAPGLVRRAGYTDEDQKTWCVVCLEDGAVRCLGCDDGDDVYCARCWREMHVGPAAGYDDRGHRWERFVKGR
ncbi:hypothetical protein GGS23DRAFT_464107 [Durotheca rogersii]|uniref:uncharacterized protein n=1 Tax=Durotheca rogersii TaxID=419775 RepID=UPI00221E8248|nr:uncharacterized protein GGS23DRAFT_464107 [Durotheca rogersii]KAI5864800.1 hypothetical protein GGS23DRAFT_464107 [Durotheca rogersii]